jgi:glutamate-ammonia-ligase adenylyltransferase
MTLLSTITPLFPHSLALSSWLCRAIEKPTLAAFLEASHTNPVNSLNLADRLEFHRQSLPADSLHWALRRLRQEHLALCLVRDVDRQAPLQEIISAMTRFAEFAIRTAHDQALAELAPRFGLPFSWQGKPQCLHVVSMGKLGGGELNVSSDIDLIFLYPDEGETNGGKTLSTDEFFSLLGKKIIHYLNDINAEGQVFRVDMRLRPHGDAGPLVMSFSAFENYLIRDGREWERYAWIKARLLLGNAETELMQLVSPFVFRKYLDFTAMESMFDLHRQIREQVQQKSMIGNIKLGRGGIREIEFIAQLLQLMRGGRRPELQQRPTCSVLRALAKGGFLSVETTERLIAHYEFLRKLEHRLQYREDQQTQTLPTVSEDLLAVVNSMGMTAAAFQQHLGMVQNDVSQEFANLFAKHDRAETRLNSTALVESSTPSIGDISSPLQTIQDLWPLAVEESRSESSIHDEQLSQALTYWRIHPQLEDDLLAHARHVRIRQLKNSAEHDHGAIIAHTLQSASVANKQVLGESFQEGDWLLRRSLDMLAVLARRPSYLRLLASSARALERLQRFLGASSWGATFLGLHPHLLDDLLDPRLLEAAFNREEFRHRVQQGIKPTMDAGERMNWLRECHHAETFRLLAQDLEGILSVETLSDHLSDVADVLLGVTLAQCWEHIRQRHRDQPRVALIAYGKLGGKELGYASDVDLVMVCDGEDEEGAVAYNKLAVSLSHWLSATTEAGILFEVDYRLRPDGDAGQLAPSLEGFAHYQRNKAWLWEHQALTRARFCAGEEDLGAAFESLRQEILSLPRDLSALRSEILAMRQKMRTSKKIPVGVFNLKHSAGGLIDIEFMVQWGVLGYAFRYPELTGNVGNIALLRLMGTLEIFPPDLAHQTADGYRDFRRAQHRLRLNDHLLSQDTMRHWATLAQPAKSLWQFVFGESLP